MSDKEHIMKAREDELWKRFVVCALLGAQSSIVARD